MMHTAKLLDEYPLIVLPSLANAVGLNESIVLQQIHFWVNTKERLNDTTTYKEGHYWVYNTLDEWQKEFSFWSLNTVKNIFSKIEKLGLVISKKFGKSNWNHKKWYRIDYEALNQMIVDCPKAGQSTAQKLDNRSNKIWTIDSPKAGQSVKQDLAVHLKDQRSLTETTYREKESTLTHTETNNTKTGIRKLEVEFSTSVSPKHLQKSKISTKHNSQDQFSASPALPSKTSVQQNEECFHPEAIPWQTASSPNSIVQGFAEFVFQKVVLKADYWRDKNPTIADAKHWIVKARYREERLDQCWLRWQEYQESLKRQPQSQTQIESPIPDYLQGPPPDMSWLREQIEQAKKEGHPYAHPATAGL